MERETVSMRHNMDIRTRRIAWREEGRSQHKAEMIQCMAETMRVHLQVHGGCVIHRPCAGCDESFPVPKRWTFRRYCAPCSAEAHYARMDAGAEVQKAIRLGVLMRPDQFRCSDCDNWATCWDHRDYSKPLKVEPVCDRHNRLRPAAYRTTRG